MSTFTAPAPLERLLAPLPVADPYTLLDTAQLVENPQDRWLGGVLLESYPAGETHVHDPCASGTFRAKAIDADFAQPMFNAFTLYLGVTCTAASFGPALDDAKRNLRAFFRATETVGVEQVLVSGEPGSDFGPYLGDTNMDDLGTADPVEALALLEQAIRGHGGGMIHAAPATASYWTQNGGITDKSGKLRTGLGTLVSVGAGYEDADPDSAASPTATSEWAFASGVVQITRSEDFVVQERYAQALDRSTNDVTLIVERNYLLSFVGRQDGSDSLHIQAGVLVDRS